MSRSQHFEELVTAVFAAHGFKAQRDVPVPIEGSRSRVDLLLTWKAEVISVVEIKLYRSRANYLPDAKHVIASVLRSQAAFHADHAIIVTNLRRDRLAPLEKLKGRHVELIGLDDLIALAPDQGLREALAKIDEELSSALGDFDGPGLAPSGRSFSPNALHMKAAAPSASSVPPPPRKGAVLRKDLLAINPGRTQAQTLPSGRSGTNWRLFEDVCYDALQYVFDGILGNWQTQKAVAGDDNRFDALAKIQGSDVFCRTLIEHYNSRHILFEFKNYTDEIGANLIHITEKYLYPKALRGVAVIISPKGLSEPAVRASHGALRDVGKLMLSVDVTLLCKLLDEKDKAKPPSEEMETLLDSFLLNIGR